MSYPINHIQNIVRPVSSAPAAKNVIFLSADAFGVLPPVSILTPEQTQYYFLSGFTAKLAGTERGITEPTPTFSACFGQAFLELHPTKYAEELVKKMKASGAKAYLVNTGWNGTGKRISIKDTRGIIDAILSGAINGCFSHCRRDKFLLLELWNNFEHGYYRHWGEIGASVTCSMNFCSPAVRLWKFCARPAVLLRVQLRDPLRAEMMAILIN